MRLENGHYLSLPRVKAILLNQPEDMADSERPQWTRNQLLEMADDLESDLVALCHTIKKDLVRKVLLRDGKSVAKLDSWDNAKLQEILDKPDVWFNCTECKEHSSTPWNGVALHACTANAKGEKHYGNRAKGWPDKACIPIGWQPDTVELADGFKGLHTLIETLARAKHDENGVLHMESTFRFPSSHSAMALDHRWKFECGGGFCWMSCARLKEFVSCMCKAYSLDFLLTAPLKQICRFSSQVPHLAKHIVDGKTTLAKLAEEHKPLIRDQYAVYSHAMYPIEDDFDSDEYHSEMSFGDMFF